AGDVDAAVKLLARAKQLNWVAQEIDLETALLQVQRDNAVAVEGYLLNCLIKNHPDSRLILEVMIPHARRQQDLPQLREYLNHQIRLDATNAQAYLDRGTVREFFQERADAVDDYRLAVKYGPDV